MVNSVYLALAAIAAVILAITVFYLVNQPQQVPNTPIENQTVVCGQGTYERNGTCVADIPICDEGELLNTTTLFCEPKPQPQIPDCGDSSFYNTTSEFCEPKNPIPNPNPIPQPLKVIVVGDVADTSSGNKVYQAIKAQNADYVFVLGDLGYSSSLKWFKSTYGTSDKTYCVAGNHDAPEDGSSSIYQETLAFCGNSYWIKNGTTLFVMLNTNDPNLSQLATKTGNVFSNSTIMNGIKTVHIMSHKPCAVPPNSHHPVEIKSFCDAIKSKIPANLKVFFDQAHNHVMSESADKIYKQTGAGGKSHYTCGTSTAFPFCNNSSYGYLQYIITDGNTTSSFIDYNGVVKR
jgi:hypothetical protein